MTRSLTHFRLFNVSSPSYTITLELKELISVSRSRNPFWLLSMLGLMSYLTRDTSLLFCASHQDKGLMQSPESDTPVTEFCVLLRTNIWIELSTLHQATLLDPAKLINFVLPWSNTESLSVSS